MPGMMVISGAQDTFLDGRGNPRMVVVTGMLSARSTIGGGRLLSQVWESWQEDHFSPQHSATAGWGRLGEEPEVISSDSAAILLPEELPWRTEHLHVALACLPANLHATQYSLGFVLRQERDTCDPDNGPGRSHWPELHLPWVSNVLSSAPAHSAPTTPRRMVTWNTEQKPTTGLSRGLTYALAMRRRM